MAEQSPAQLPHPPVKWAQRTDVLFVSIPLHSISDEQVTLSERKLSVRLRGGPDLQSYAVDLELFKPVLPKESKQSKSERELFLLIKKRSSGPYWPRLIKSSTTPSFLKVDYEKWRDEDDSGDEEQRLKQELLIPADPISVVEDTVPPDFDEELQFEAISSSREIQQKLANGMRGYEDDIPEVDQVPTLESILNQESDDTISIEELGIDTAASEYSDLSGQDEDSILQPEVNGDRSLPPYSCVKTDSLINFRPINRLTGQLKKLSERKETYGSPTCIGSGGPYIAVGTSRGAVLLFDFTGDVSDGKRGQLRFVMAGDNAKNDWEDYGSVTSLSFNCDHTRLLVGHSKGQLVQWNVEANVCLRDITNAHRERACVLQVKYTDVYNTALFSDITGSIFTLTFKRVYGVRTQDSVCIFSGSRGEALVFEPLRLQWDMPDHPLAKHHLVAIGTIDKVIVISLKPMKAVFGSKLANPPSSLPLVAWKVCRVKEGSDSTFHPVLAVARGGFIAFTQVSVTANGTVKGKVWKQYKKKYTIIAIHWLASHFIAAVDSSEHVHLIYVPNGKEYQVVDITSAQIVYGNSIYKALEAGTGAPKTMIAASQYVCHNSVIMRSGAFEVFMLGENMVHAISIAPWRVRIKQILSKDSSLSTIHRVLDLAMGFYQGRYVGMIGYKGTEKAFKRDVKKAIGQLINTSHQQWMAHAKEKDSNDPNWKLQLKEHITSMADKCLFFKLHKVLYSTVIDPSQQDPGVIEVYFDALEPFILRGEVPYLTSPLMEMMIGHYRSKDKYQQLQSCLVNLDVSMLDLHGTVKMCMNHGLYDALIYIYNRGLQDYITPLEELLLQLRKVLRENEVLPDFYRTMGYKLLVYISCSLAGRAYPKGDIPPDLKAGVKVEICRLLFVSKNDYDATDTENYPHLRTLLHFDTREFLNVLTLAFEEEEFESPEVYNLKSRQEIVELLMNIVGRNTDATRKNSEFTPTQVGCLFTFLARQGARYPNSIQVSVGMYDKVLEYLTTPDEEFITEERQQAFIELLDSGALSEIDEDRLLSMAEKAKFYRVCERFYQKKRHFAKVLSCYWRDPRRKSQALYYIHQVMSSDRYSVAEKEEIEKATIENFEVLIMTDTRATARLFVMDFPHTISAVSSRLTGHPQVQFVFLQGIFESKLLRPEIQVTCHVVEKYIELMCTFKPDGLDFFLRNNSQYQLEEALVIVERYNHLGAMAYLKERTGDYEGAYMLLMKLFRVSCDEVLEKFFTTIASKEEWDKVQNDVKKRFESVLNLLLRSSRNLPEDRRNSLWYKFLDIMISIVSRSKKASNKLLSDFFQDFMMKLLNAMTMFISLTEILQLILKDREFSSGQFKDFKKLLLGMFETNNYESTLRSVTSRILHDDVTMAIQNMRALTNKGMSPSSLRCVVCSHKASATFGGLRRDVVIFHCGHLYHSNCLYSPSEELSTMTCPKCTKSSAPRSTRGGTLKLNHLPKQMSFNQGTALSGLSLDLPGADQELDSWQIANLERMRSKKEAMIAFSE